MVDLIYAHADPLTRIVFRLTNSRFASPTLHQKLIKTSGDSYEQRLAFMQSMLVAGRKRGPLATNVCAKAGYTHLLLDLIGRKFPLSRDILLHAARGGHAIVFDCLVHSGCRIRDQEKLLVAAVESGNSNMVHCAIKTLREKDGVCPFTAQLAEVVAKTGNREIFDCFVSHCGNNAVYLVHEQSPIILAKGRGQFFQHVEALALKLISYSKVKAELEWVCEIAKKGYLQCLQILVDSKTCHGVELLLGHKIVFKSALESGNLALLEWLLGQGTELTADIFNKALCLNNQEVVDWLTAKNCPRDVAVYMFQTGKRGRKELEKFLENGFALTKDCTAGAAAAGDVATLIWLLEQGVELHSYATFLAGSHFQIDTLNYLLPTEAQRREFANKNTVITINEEGKYAVSFYNKGLYSLVAVAGNAAMMRWLISYRTEPPDMYVRACYTEKNKSEKIFF